MVEMKAGHLAASMGKKKVVVMASCSAATKETWMVGSLALRSAAWMAEMMEAWMVDSMAALMAEKEAEKRVG